MNHIYIGDRELDPPEDDYCEACDGFDTIYHSDGSETPCPECNHEDDPEPDNDPAK